MSIFFQCYYINDTYIGKKESDIYSSFYEDDPFIFKLKNRNIENKIYMNKDNKTPIQKQYAYTIKKIGINMQNKLLL